MRKPIRHMLQSFIILYAFFAPACEWGQEPAKVAQGPSKLSIEERSLVKENGTVDQNLLAFLDLYGLQHDGTVASINQAMQENFLRKPGKERRDLEDKSIDQEVQGQAMTLLTKMGFVEAIPHATVNPDYFLLFGAMIGGIERRFRDFMQQYNQGTLQCRNLVLLGGARKLRTHEIDEMKQELGEGGFADFLKQVHQENETALTETDLFRFVWKTRATAQMQEHFTEGNNLLFVNATKTTDGTNDRPTTRTTLEAWHEDYHPEPGSCHANVEKPYGVRLEKTLKLFLAQQSWQLKGNKRFSITWNSPRASRDLRLAVYKDELARAFNTELALRRFIETR